MKALITLMTMVFALMVKGQTNIPAFVAPKNHHPCPVWVVTQSSGEVPVGTVLYYNGGRGAVFTNGTVVYLDYRPENINNVVKLGNTVITNTEERFIFHHCIRTPKTTYSRQQGSMTLYVSGDKFIEIKESTR